MANLERAKRLVGMLPERSTCQDLARTGQQHTFDAALRHGGPRSIYIIASTSRSSNLRRSAQTAGIRITETR